MKRLLSIAVLVTLLFGVVPIANATDDLVHTEIIRDTLLIELNINSVSLVGPHSVEESVEKLMEYTEMFGISISADSINTLNSLIVMGSQIDDEMYGDDFVETTDPDQTEADKTASLETAAREESEDVENSLNLNAPIMATTIEMELEVRQPFVFSVSQNQAKAIGQRKFTKEIESLKNEAAQRNISVDLDDYDFQQLVKERSFDIEFLEFAKFIDTYENYDYNAKMESLKHQIANRVYTSVEELTSDSNISELYGMMPIDIVKYPYAQTGSGKSSVSSTIKPLKLPGYNPGGATGYASIWWNKTNNTSYPYYALYNNHPDPYNNNMNSFGTGNNKRTWNDCANFVSQCLYAGGATYAGSIDYSNYQNWYYNNLKPSNTWGGATNFIQHWNWRCGTRQYLHQGTPGDPIGLDINGDGLADHIMIIVYEDPYASDDAHKILLAGHTNDSFLTVSLGYVYDIYAGVWIPAVA